MLRSLKTTAAIVLFLVAALFVALPSSVTRSSAEADQADSTQLIGLERAHAHNDYEHDRPLFDALDHIAPSFSSSR
jgi:hypothetical protein